MLTSNDLNTSKTTLEIDAPNNKINYEFAIAIMAVSISDIFTTVL